MGAGNFICVKEDISKNRIIDTDECYTLAEKRATEYYNTLFNQFVSKTYIPILIKDFKVWQQKHINFSIRLQKFFGFDSKLDSKDLVVYIKWMNKLGRLENYLERSVSYIFMRDLGENLSENETQQKVSKSVKELKEYLLNWINKPGEKEFELTGMAWLYRKAQKEHIETSMIWLVDKLKNVSKHIPDGMDKDQAKRKLIKIIAGVLMHEINEMDDETPDSVRIQKLEIAVRLGYSYGITYPFIDDLLDADILSMEEKNSYSELIRSTLTTGTVPQLFEWNGGNSDLVMYIYSELSEAFKYIKANQKPETFKNFLEQAYVFFNSQEEDRKKELSNQAYTNEDLFIPSILKAASSRFIARSVTGVYDDSSFDTYTFCYGIYNQLADDFADMFEDMEAGRVTPYTYYMKYHEKRADLINPFELYWTVIFHIIHNVYNSDSKTCEVILSRAVNGLKRYKLRMGCDKYKEVIELLTPNIQELNNIIQEMVEKADDVDFFDKLLRDRMLTSLRNENNIRDAFKEMMKDIRKQINDTLKISKESNDQNLNQTILHAANYSLESDGKRLRPLMAWIVGSDVYGLSMEQIMPLLRALEYMHTASLIFDDLPSQDNSDIRRGNKTLHNAYNVAVAELTGLFLVQRAVEEQTTLSKFDSESILKLISYSSSAMQEMCKGQMMDLESRGKNLSIEELNTMCFYKTGLAFEASLVMPAILARAKETEISTLKKFAWHAGIAFQIKDDLLDVEGDKEILGKPGSKDVKNGSSTFVTLLGSENAKKKMWDHYCYAVEALKEVSNNVTHLNQLLNYIVNRDH